METVDEIHLCVFEHDDGTIVLEVSLHPCLPPHVFFHHTFLPFILSSFSFPVSPFPSFLPYCYLMAEEPEGKLNEG